MYVAQFNNDGVPNDDRQNLAWSQNRSFLRYTYRVQAEIITSNGNKTHCSVLDLSQSGCRVQSFTDIVHLQNFRIKLPNIESLWADVIWKAEYVYGVQFRKPLSIYVVEHLVKSADASK